jgi:chromosome segregation ATPase
MKKTILQLTLTGIMIGTSLTSFGQQNKKVEKERKNVAEAKDDLREAKKDSAADFQKFKLEAETKIRENQTKIAELKAKKASDNKESKEKYDKKVAALDKKNNELKAKIEGCGNTKTSNWTAFKREFSHDMNELGHAFKDVAVNNTNVDAKK